MTAAELIASLQAMPPGARVLAKWECELYDVTPATVIFRHIHIGHYSKGNHAACEDGYCHFCEYDEKKTATEPGVIIG